QIGADIPAGATTLRATAAVPDPVPGTYTAHVRADRNNQFPGAYGAAGSVNVLSLSTPPAPALSQEEGALTATWTAQQGLRYEVRVSEGTTVLAASQVSTGTAVLTPSTPFGQGSSYTVALRATDGAALSPWTTTTFTFWTLPAPGSATLEYNTGVLLARWTAIQVTGTPTPAYNLELIDMAAPGVPIGAASGVAQPPVSLSRTDGQAPLAGAEYAMRVRGVIAGNLGPWSQSQPIAVVALSPPTAVALSYAPRQFTLSWTEPPLPPPLTGPLTFDIELIDGGSVVAEPSNKTGTTANPSRSDGQVPVPGQVYTAQVVALVPAHTNRGTMSPAITIMDVPRLTESSYAANVVTVGWTPSAVAGAAYDVDLQPGPGGGADFQVPVVGSGGAPAPTTAHIDMTGRARWTYAIRVRARSAGSAGDWSEPVTVAVIDPPTGLAVSYAGSAVTASWAAATGLVTGYELTLRKPDGTTAGSWPVTAAPGANEPPTTFKLPAGAVQPGISYSLVAATNAGTAMSAPSAPVPVELLTAPTGVTATGNVTAGASIQVS